MSFIADGENYSDGALSESDAKALLKTAFEAVTKDIEAAIKDTGRTNTLDLTSPMTVRWDLSGLRSPVEIETNVLGLLFLEFYSIKELHQWDIGIAEVLEDLRKGTCLIVGENMDWIADQLSAMNRQFGTMTPEPTLENTQLLNVLIQDYCSTAIYFKLDRIIRGRVFDLIDLEVREAAQSLAEKIVIPGMLIGVSE